MQKYINFFHYEKTVNKKKKLIAVKEYFVIKEIIMADIDDNLFYKIALTQIEGVGPVLAKNLVSYCGGAKEVFEQKKLFLSKIPGVGKVLADEIKKDSVFENAGKIVEKIAKNGTGVLFYLDDGYPSRLKHLPDSPVILYYEGTGEYNNKRTLGVVGTRSASRTGKLVCEQIVSQLKDYNVTVISGLAFGIDSVAHRTAIKNGMPNIAVMGSGIDITYPGQHEKLRREIVQKGDVITEFPPGTAPDRGHFPMRNRIIAGLSDALLVVESDKRGGSMITAQIAFDYNKDVFAVPGRVTDRYSRGTNYLIKRNISQLVESAEDIALNMNWDKVNEKTYVQMQMFADITGDEQKIVDILRQSPQDSLSIDELHYASGFTMGELAAIVLNLELKGVIESLPGTRYSLAQ